MNNYGRFSDPQFDQLMREQPKIFQKDSSCGSCWNVKDVKAFENGIIRNLAARGFCALAGEEFGVKQHNGFNEQYDLLTWDMRLRRGQGAYRGTCYPAAF